MKNTIKLALVAAMAMGATSAFATNGDNLIGLGAKSRAMGGTGIAHHNGAESSTSNPALITKNKGSNVSFGGTYFTPDVSVTTTAGNNTNPALGTGTDSAAKHNVIPYVALTENLGNGWAVGASMFGSAGMGTDWRRDGGASNTPAAGTVGLYSMRSNLLLLKFSVPIAYAQDNWSVGIAPVLMYGSLDISYNSASPTDGANVDIGNGSSASFGTGLELGASYDLPDTGITLGAIYHSEIAMEYLDQISSASAGFGYGAAPTSIPLFSDRLDQPAEYGVGIDWSEGDLSVTADMKQVRWDQARGYKDFGWQKQNVYALGAEYRMDDLAVRLGYNYAKNPIAHATNTNTVQGGAPGAGNPMDSHVKNAFNSVMFPAVTERHYTIGAGYQFTKNVGADFAFTYATSGIHDYVASTVGLGVINVRNDQMAFSGNLNYSF